MSDLAEMLASAKVQGIKEGREDAIDRFVEFLNNIFECRHDMYEIRKLAEEFKEKNEEW